MIDWVACKLQAMAEIHYKLADFYIWIIIFLLCFKLKLWIKRFKIIIFFCLQALCKELNQKIDTVDEERYDFEVKVTKNNKEANVSY